MKKEIKLVIEKTPDSHDSDNVRFMLDGKEVGFGYRGKEKDDLICIQRCPMCGRENYGVMIAKGICVFCNFNPNK